MEVATRGTLADDDQAVSHTENWSSDFHRRVRGMISSSVEKPTSALLAVKAVHLQAGNHLRGERPRLPSHLKMNHKDSRKLISDSRIFSRAKPAAGLEYHCSTRWRTVKASMGKGGVTAMLEAGFIRGCRIRLGCLASRRQTLLRRPAQQKTDGQYQDCMHCPYRIIFHAPRAFAPVFRLVRLSRASSARHRMPG